MTRAYNFSAGPAALPESVLRRAQEELLDYQGLGLSVMEMSHRSREFIGLAEQAEADLRELLGVSEEFEVLFLQGGATTQFAMVPLNLLHESQHADYVDTGAWSTKAIKEAQRLGEVRVVASSAANGYIDIPDPSQWQTSRDAAYLHFTANETIGGVEFQSIPENHGVPLVSDMSSTLLSRPLDVSKFGLIYAGAQKNLGPAGLTLVIIRKELMGHAGAHIPSMLDYQNHANAASMFNTPPTFAWYVTGLVFRWLKQLGGLEAMAAINQRKAEKLYTAIDHSNFYRGPVVPAFRSWMNVPFTLADDRLDADFLAGAEAAGLLNLKGHRSVGGMRASLYNAVPEAAVDALVDYMLAFEKERA